MTWVFRAAYDASTSLESHRAVSQNMGGNSGGQQARLEIIRSLQGSPN